LDRVVLLYFGFGLKFFRKIPNPKYNSVTHYNAIPQKAKKLSHNKQQLPYISGISNG